MVFRINGFGEGFLLHTKTWNATIHIIFHISNQLWIYLYAMDFGSEYNFYQKKKKKMEQTAYCGGKSIVFKKCDHVLFQWYRIKIFLRLYYEFQEIISRACEPTNEMLLTNTYIYWVMVFFSHSVSKYHCMVSLTLSFCRLFKCWE